MPIASSPWTNNFTQLVYTVPAKHIRSDCLCHPMKMAVETTWELHTLTVMNSCV